MVMSTCTKSAFMCSAIYLNICGNNFVHNLCCFKNTRGYTIHCAWGYILMYAMGGNCVYEILTLIQWLLQIGHWSNIENTVETLIVYVANITLIQ